MPESVRPHVPPFRKEELQPLVYAQARQNGEPIGAPPEASRRYSLGHHVFHTVRVLAIVAAVAAVIWLLDRWATG